MSASSFAYELRMSPNITPAMIVRAADTIDTLLEVIALQRGPVEVKPAIDLAPLRELRAWHYAQGKRHDELSNGTLNMHWRAVQTLNAYFTDKLAV